MMSKWVIVLSFLLLLLSAPGLCREAQEGSSGSSADPALGSPAPLGSTTALGPASPAGPSPYLQTGPASVAGTWSLVLVDGATGRSLPLEADISQIDGVIFGRGAVGGTGTTATFLPLETEPRPTRDEGIRSMVWWLHQDPAPVTQAAQARYLTVGASGTVSGQSVSLDLIFLDQFALYRLDLAVFGNSVSGGYLAYDAGGGLRSGSCYGSILPGRGRAAVPLGGTHSPVTVGGSSY